MSERKFSSQNLARISGISLIKKYMDKVERISYKLTEIGSKLKKNDLHDIENLQLDSETRTNMLQFLGEDKRASDLLIMAINRYEHAISAKWVIEDKVRERFQELMDAFNWATGKDSQIEKKITRDAMTKENERQDAVDIMAYTPNQRNNKDTNEVSLD